MLRSLTLFVLLALTPIAETEPVVSSPTKLLLRIEGFLGPSYSVALVPESSAVLYRRNPETFTSAEGTQEEIIEIPKERWPIFWKRLQEARVWDWKKQYRDSRVVDGTVWEVSVDWRSRRIRSTGSNAYPDRKDFGALEFAIAELLGVRKLK